jgi:hypothetical protein
MMRSSRRTNLSENPSKQNPGSQKRCLVGEAASIAKTPEKTILLRRNVRCARDNWGKLSKSSICLLSELTEAYSLSIAAGHLQLLDGRWYITLWPATLGFPQQVSRNQYHPRRAVI